MIYRRLDEDRLSAPDGSLTALGELLLPALESGRLRCVNAFGTGLADDKLAHAYVEQHGPLLPRRGAAAALGPELSTSATRTLARRQWSGSTSS